MREAIFTVAANAPAAREVFRLTLRGDTGGMTAPGQFVNIALPGKYLRRPLSVCDWDGAGMTLLYKVVGEGTAQLARMAAGEKLCLLTGLGNGFDPAAGGERPALVGGGLGAAPMLALARALLARGAAPRAYLGFASAEDAVLTGELKELGVETAVATMDGALGHRGFVTDLLPGDSYVFTCGPEPMLRAVWTKAADGQFSFESRMGCGFGACMGCTCETHFGPKRVCRDGPVFRKGEILW